MLNVSDKELVWEFSKNSSEAAFSELVSRHINLVYSLALRYTANDQDAQDVTQAVFIILAKKASKLCERTALTGWLYETTRLAASGFLRTRARRQTREQEALMESNINESASDSVWQQLAPHLEEAMSRLGEGDRALLALRYFENKTGAETAALLGIGEASAHKRTARALEKMRRFFGQRGIALTVVAISGAVSANSVQAAPSGLTNTISAVAMAKGATASAPTLTLVKGALKLMAWTKAKTAVVAVIILAASGTTGLVGYKIVQAHHNPIPSMTMAWDMQADGTSLIETTIEAANQDKTFGPNGINGPFYSAMDIQRFTDGNGRAIKYTKEPATNGNPFKYTLALNQVRPGEKITFKMQGTVDGLGTGLIKTTGEPGVFEYNLPQRTGAESVTHQINVYRLPAGAVLLEKSPADLTTTTKGGRVELKMDKILPPPGSFDIRFRYRLSAAAR